MQRPWKPLPHIGIDYQLNHITAVSLETLKHLPPLRPLVSQSFSNPDELDTIFKLLLKKIGRARITLGLPIQDLLQQELPWETQLEENEITLYTKENCAKWFHLASEQLLFDWEFFYSDLQAQQQSMRVFAITESYVQPLIACCSQYRFKLLHIESTVHAQIRLLQHHQLLSEHLTALFLLTNKALTLVILQHHNVLHLQSSHEINATKLLQHFDAQYPQYPLQFIYISSLINDAEKINTLLTQTAFLPNKLLTFDIEKPFTSAAGLALRGLYP